MRLVDNSAHHCCIRLGLGQRKGKGRGKGTKLTMNRLFKGKSSTGGKPGYLKGRESRVFERKPDDIGEEAKSLRKSQMFE